MSQPSLLDLQLSERPGAVRFDVRVRPRASRTAILGTRERALHVALAAPPVDGEANAELVRAISSALGVPTRDVSIVAGERGRRKVVEVRGLDSATVLGRLSLG